LKFIQKKNRGKKERVIVTTFEMKELIEKERKKRKSPHRFSSESQTQQSEF